MIISKYTNLYSTKEEEDELNCAIHYYFSYLLINKDRTILDAYYDEYLKQKDYFEFSENIVVLLLILLKHIGGDRRRIIRENLINYLNSKTFKDDFLNSFIPFQENSFQIRIFNRIRELYKEEEFRNIGRGGNKLKIKKVIKKYK